MNSFLKFLIFLYLNFEIFSLNILSAQRLERDIPLQAARNLSSSERQSKLFPFFAVVQFSNTMCTGTSGEHGTCYSSHYCKKRDGKVIGSCSHGYGTCCLIKKSCNGNRVVEIVENNTIIANDPEKKEVCQFSLPKLEKVSQVRLDFLHFEIEGPTNGNCDKEWMSIHGSKTVENLQICGNNTGQHMYLTYGGSERIILRLHLNPDNVAHKSNYSIRVVQIKSDTKRPVPYYCLQYFTGSFGMIRSFNHPEPFNTTLPKKEQLNNQYYTTCIDPEEPYEDIIWTKCSDTKESFFVGGKPNFDDSTCNPQNDDYVSFFGSGKFCGNIFHPLKSEAKPFLIRTNFDDKEILVPQIPNYGTECPPPTNEYECFKDPDTGICTCPLLPDSPSFMNTDELNTGYCLKYQIN